MTVMARGRFSFNFAQTQGVFLGQSPEGKEVLYRRDDALFAALNEVKHWCGYELPVTTLDPELFDKSLQQAYADQSGDSLSEMEGMEGMMGLDEVAAALQEPEDLLKSQDDAPVIRMLNAIFFEAINQKASDIHIEPYERKLYIRFRLDGVLKSVLTPPVQIAPLLVSRVKVLARLDIAEKRVPQDGRISLLLGGRAVDLRVSTLPSSYGERAVLRILDKGTEQPSLDGLGMGKETHQRFRQMVQRPHGIVLVTGPTGSGKSTTLYAALGEIDRRRRNIMTIEDPIEYNIEGISQTQVNIKAGMTFVRGLRAILRQDPDVVLIGEIRDKETADIAVQASLTGHLVLSTLHTNTAIGAVTRLCDMGVEPFLLTSTLQGVLAQRLVRRLCPNCREPYEADPEKLKHWSIDPEIFGKDQKIYRAKGCDECHSTGYIGRFGLFDLMTMDDQLRQMVHDNISEIEMEKYIRKFSKSLRDVGLDCIIAGETSLDEVLAVTLDF